MTTENWTKPSAPNCEKISKICFGLLVEIEAGTEDQTLDSHDPEEMAFAVVQGPVASTENVKVVLGLPAEANTEDLATGDTDVTATRAKIVAMRKAVVIVGQAEALVGLHNLEEVVFEVVQDSVASTESAKVVSDLPGEVDFVDRATRETGVMATRADIVDKQKVLAIADRDQASAGSRGVAVEISTGIPGSDDSKTNVPAALGLLVVAGSVDLTAREGDGTREHIGTGGSGIHDSNKVSRLRGIKGGPFRM